MIAGVVVEGYSLMKVGILALQGDFEAHARAVSRIGVEAVEVRRPHEIEPLDCLIMPGGESTTMLKLITEERFIRPVEAFARSGRPLFGTCAGAILLARDVQGPEQPSLGLLDIGIQRNAYGRQVDSFIGVAETSLSGGPLEAVFIRAPRIVRVGPTVEVLATLGDDPVLVRSANILAATFHPELTRDERVHRLLVDCGMRTSDRGSDESAIHNPNTSARNPQSAIRNPGGI